MSEEMDSQKALDAVKATTTVVKECLDAGMYLGKKCFKEIAIFVELGLVVRTVIGFTEPGQKDPVLKEIGELSDKLDKIEEKMKENFNDLKAFVSQYSFYNDVPLAGALLSQFMHKALKAPSEVTRDRFKQKYEAFPPVEYARRLNHQLSKTTTNPLKMLMASDPLTGKKTFDKWQENYESVLTQLGIVEASACHLFNNNDRHQLKQIEAEFKTFESHVDKWRSEYQRDDHYWPDAVRKIVEEIQEKNTSKTSDEKAEMICKKLEAILTSDVLTVVVFRQAYKYAYYANQPSQTILSSNRGDCNVFVYRSRRADLEPEKVKQFQKNVETLKRAKLEFNRLHGFYDSKRLQAVTNGLLRESGLVVMVTDGQYVGIRSTKTEKVKDGAGGNFNGKLKPFNLHHRAHTPDIPFFLFTAYK